jgi:hypothetical protein
MESDDLLCSRNARPQKALVGCAQWKVNQPPSLKRSRASLEGLPVASFEGHLKWEIGQRLPGSGTNGTLEMAGY